MKVMAGIVNVLFAAIIIIPALLKYLKLRIFSPASLKDARGKRVSDEGIKHPPVKGVHHEFILCDDVKIHVARAGTDASKTLMLFLHGFPEFWYSWRFQLEALQDSYEVAAIDLPGYNASGKPSRVSHYITQDICRMIAGVLTGLCRDSCVLVGHDWGAAIASDFAAMYPRKVSKLALLAGTPGNLFIRNMDWHQFSKSYYMWRFLVPRVMEAVIPANDWAAIRAALSSPAAGGPLRNHIPKEDVEYYLDACAVPGALESALNYYRAAMWHSGVLGLNKETKYAWKANSRHAMPLLVLIGDSDAFINLNSLRKIGRIAAKATVRILPDCSHWVQQDAADEVNRLLKEFVEMDHSEVIL